MEHEAEFGETLLSDTFAAALAQLEVLIAARDHLEPLMSVREIDFVDEIIDVLVAHELLEDDVDV